MLSGIYRLIAGSVLGNHIVNGATDYPHFLKTLRDISENKKTFIPADR